MSRMDLVDRSDTRIKQHTEAMRRILTSFEDGDIRVQTFTLEMTRQVRELFNLLSEMKKG